MARPVKVGLDYFPLDCVLDDKIGLIEAEFGLTGFAVVIKLFQKIYSEKGYYCNWTKEVALLFARKCGVGGNVVSEIVNSSLKRGIFDKNLYSRYGILTSKGIQKRYFEAVSRRKQIEVKSEYLLIKGAPFSENSENNSVFASNNPINVSINPQRKVKEKKLYKSKSEERGGENRNPLSSFGKFKNVFLSDSEVSKLAKDYPNSYKAKIDRLSTYLESSGRSYLNHYAKLIEWLDQDCDEEKATAARTASYDIDELEKPNMLDGY